MTTLEGSTAPAAPLHERPLTVELDAPGSRGRRRAERADEASRLPKFRKDIEGLRAIAVLAVVLYHAGVPGFTGGYIGVDVFFVISGYLITRQLLTELEKRGRISIAGFYARRVRRLLPASALVVLATLIASWSLLNPLRAKEVTSDALWTLIYGLNWNLAAEGTDYLTATAPPSPLQHYWSLAIEEQFYVVWPLLMLLASGAVLTRGRRVFRTGLMIALTATIAYSLHASIQLTTDNQPYAYFGLHTRAWELAIGAAIAVGAERLARSLPLAFAAVASWLGLATVIATVFVYTDTTVFPGWTAAVPVGGAALALAAGCAAPRGGAEVLLRRPSMQFFGAMSYSWYLWHWPILLLAPAYYGAPLDLRHRLLMVVLALGLAWLSYHLVENPIRTMKWPAVHPWRALRLGFGVSAAIAAIALVVPLVLPSNLGTGQASIAQDLSPSDESSDEIQAAVQRGLATTTAPANLSPALRDVGAPSSIPAPQRDGCHASFTDIRPRMDCAYGAVDADRTIVLFGDSHALQWFAPLEKIAVEKGYRLLNVTKSSCTPMSMTIWNDALRREYRECNEWRAAAVQEIAKIRPEMVVLSTYTGIKTEGLYGSETTFDREWGRGTARTVESLKVTSRVVVLGDTTVPNASVPNCVADHIRDVGACVFFRAGGELAPDRRAIQVKAAADAGALTINPVPWMCDAERCPVIVDNLLIYRDESHISTSYALWLTPVLETALKLPA